MAPDSLFNKRCWETRYSLPKVNSKWVKDLTVKLKSIKLLEANEGLSDDFFGRDTQANASEINGRDDIELKSYTAKQTTKHKATYGTGKIFRTLNLVRG